MSQAVAVVQVKVNGSLDWGCSGENQVKEIFRRAN